jgi:hypothetical protein
MPERPTMPSKLPMVSSIHSDRVRHGCRSSQDRELGREADVGLGRPQRKRPHLRAFRLLRPAGA